MNEPEQHEQLPNKLDHLHREEAKLWRISLFFLALLATGLAAASWQNLRQIPQRLEALPVGTVVLVVLFALYVASKRREISDLRGMLQGMQQTVSTLPSQQQITHLTDVLAQSQRHYRELIDSFADVVVSVSLSGIIQTMNRSFTDLLQRPFSELAGQNLEDFIAEPTRQDVEKELAQFLQRRHWSGVVRVRFRQSNEVRYFDCLLHPILNEGVVVGVSILAHDITGQRERESRFTELFETLQEGVYFSTPEGKFLDCNNALVRMLGYGSKEELLRTPAQELYPNPGDRPAVLRGLEQNRTVRQEIRLRRKDGQSIICLNTGRAVTDGSGNVVRYQGALIDVTEQRQVEERLQVEEEFRRRLVDSFPDLILALDSSGRYTFVSPRVREVLGFTPDQFLGKMLSEPGVPAQNPEFERLFGSLITGKELFASAEYTVEHHDGSWRMLRAHASPLFDSQKRLSGVVASVRDVTTLKQLEAQLIQTERMAAMGQMIDGFAHELNNPLTAILGAVELLEHSSSDAGTTRKLQLLKQQARRAAEVVQNLLFFSRPPAGGKTHISLSELVQRSLQLHEHSLRVNNVAVDFLQEPGLPGVVLDPNQLMQVFLNLIINAEQAIREVRQRGTLRVRLGRAGDKVWASFQDDGPGIPPDVLPKIFDPFYTTKRPGRGTGLGLSVCMAILKKYQGAIDVKAAPGGGSVFTVTLPARTAPSKVTAIATTQ